MTGETLTAIIAAIALLVSVFNAWNSSRTQRIKEETEKEKIKTDRKASDVTNTGQLQEIYQTAFGDFEVLWKRRLEEQQRDHEKDLEDQRVEMTKTYKQKEEILQFRIADLKSQIERLHGFVVGQTGDFGELWKRRSDELYSQRLVDPTKNNMASDAQAPDVKGI